jgi:hypothetical protein
MERLKGRLFLCCGSGEQALALAGGKQVLGDYAAR